MEALDPLQSLEEGPGCCDSAKLFRNVHVWDVAEEHLLVAHPPGHSLVCEVHGGEPDLLLVDGCQEVI